MKYLSRKEKTIHERQNRRESQRTDNRKMDKTGNLKRKGMDGVKDRNTRMKKAMCRKLRIVSFVFGPAILFKSIGSI